MPSAAPASDVVLSNDEPADHDAPELEAVVEAPTAPEKPLDQAARLRRTLIVVATSDPPEPANDEDDDPALDAELEFVDGAQAENNPRFDPLQGDEEDEPPFDPPELDEAFTIFETEEEEEPARDLVLGASNEHRVGQPRTAIVGDAQQPAPPIVIRAFWDRPDVGQVLAAAAADRRLARARMEVARGGFDAAFVRLQSEAPDLLIVDSTLRTPNVLASVDHLKDVIARGAKVIVIGAVNDVTLFRELAQRGVSEYILSPVAPDVLASAICRLYAEADKSRVIAVVGARGGIGASTVAHNLAWSIAERQGVGVTLIDLDLPFGAAALNFRLQAPRSLGDALIEEGGEQLEDVVARRTERLHVLTAPANVGATVGMDGEALEKVISGARRMSAFVVLDVPHLWSGWVKQALTEADEVVVVASPDLASLRNADNMLKFLREARRGSAPVVALSMVGVPKRPEIPLKEFAEALDVMPAVSLAFEPSLFGEASMSGRMLGEVAPRAKAAQSLDELATALTGHAACLEPDAEFSGAPLELAQVLVEEPPGQEAKQEASDETGKAGALESGDDNDDDAASDDACPFDPNDTAKEVVEAAEDAAEASSDEARGTPKDESASLEQTPIILLPMSVQEDYIERARKAAHVEAFADEDDDYEYDAEPARAPFGFARMFAAGATVFVVMVAAGAWYVQSQMRSASAVQPSAADAAIPTPPPAPADPAERYAAAVSLLDTNEAQAATLMRELGEDGYPLAQYHLAKLYENGDGVVRDIVLARQWTERAAAAGNVRAMYDLGVYHAMGEGAPVNEAEAFRWFQQAAEFGLADGQYNLGVLYQQGRGVEANAGEALFWLSLAARQGDEAAAERASELENELPAMEVEQVQMRLGDFQPRVPDARANGAVSAPVSSAVDGASDLEASPDAVETAPAPVPEVVVEFPT